MEAKLTNSLDLCKIKKLTPVIQNWITDVILKTDNSIRKKAYNSPGLSSSLPGDDKITIFKDRAKENDKIKQTKGRIFPNPPFHHHENHKKNKKAILPLTFYRRRKLCRRR